MATFQKISGHLHHDERFTNLGDDARLALFLLFTHPNLTALGAMRATVSGLAEEFHWEVERLRAAMTELQDTGWIDWDPAVHFISFPEYTTIGSPLYNGVANANQISGSWVRALAMLPLCAARARLVRARARYLRGLSPEVRAKIAPQVFEKFKDSSNSGTASRTPSRTPSGTVSSVRSSLTTDYCQLTTDELTTDPFPRAVRDGEAAGGGASAGEVRTSRREERRERAEEVTDEALRVLDVIAPDGRYRNQCVAALIRLIAEGEAQGILSTPERRTVELALLVARWAKAQIDEASFQSRTPLQIWRSLPTLWGPRYPEFEASALQWKDEGGDEEN